MLALALAWSLAAPMQEPAAKTPPPIYDTEVDAAAQIDAALGVARKKNQRVLLVWGAEW